MIRRMDSSRLRAAFHSEAQVQAAGNEGVLGAVSKGVNRHPRNMVGHDCVGQRILVVLMFQLLYFVFLMPSGILEKPGFRACNFPKSLGTFLPGSHLH